MINNFDIEVDTKDMTLEELKDARKKIRDILAHLEYQISLRKMADHKQSSTQSTTR